MEVGQSFSLIVFDLDGTLTRSKQPIQAEMAELLTKLLEKYRVAIISGASFKQFEWQVLAHLECEPAKMRRLTLLPVDGTVSCTYENSWLCRGDKPISEEGKKKILRAFNNIFQESNLEHPDKIYGELVEDRGGQLNFSALGQDAPPELKEKWDPDTKKRQRMVEVLEKILPDFSIRIGGTTSIEITPAGVDKAYGLRRLMGSTGLSREDILYIGDKLSVGGNDAPVLTLGIKVKEVDSPSATVTVIKKLLK